MWADSRQFKYSRLDQTSMVLSGLLCLRHADFSIGMGFSIARRFAKFTKKSSIVRGGIWSKTKSPHKSCGTCVPFRQTLLPSLYPAYAEVTCNTHSNLSYPGFTARPLYSLNYNRVLSLYRFLPSLPPSPRRFSYCYIVWGLRHRPSMTPRFCDPVREENERGTNLPRQASLSNLAWYYMIPFIGYWMPKLLATARSEERGTRSVSHPKTSRYYRLWDAISGERKQSAAPPHLCAQHHFIWIHLEKNGFDGLGQE
ncbi:hypothetical protein EDD15DRAFT_2192834 [Pisolithus albus]|nr:hypothetical protein EDD15DRAFT_2192834 [Pisolithus albus]